ncbi:hypothetical protein CHUAL_011257 [Chamberlinius hualienensis]
MLFLELELFKRKIKGERRMKEISRYAFVFMCFANIGGPDRWMDGPMEVESEVPFNCLFSSEAGTIGVWMIAVGSCSERLFRFRDED